LLKRPLEKLLEICFASFCRVAQINVTPVKTNAFSCNVANVANVANVLGVTPGLLKSTLTRIDILRDIQKWLSRFGLPFSVGLSNK
jgi:hypothetical protein